MCRFLFKKLLGKLPLQRLRGRWKDNIVLGLWKIGWELDGIGLGM
jgi:hypothetical protein